MDFIVYSKRNPNENDFKNIPPYAYFGINYIEDTFFMRTNKRWIKMAVEYEVFHNQTIIDDLRK